MARYHINGKGEPGLCRATKVCPFGDMEKAHYESREAAQSAYEASWEVRPPEMKRLNEAGLRDAILNEAQLSAAEKMLLSESMEFAEGLHSHQRRKEFIQGRENTPYIEHPLRNTLRLIRWGVKDNEILMAMVLHDTVEDCSEKFVDDDELTEAEARQLLSRAIGDRYGARTAALVESVTNPIKETQEDMSRDEKQAAYRAQVAIEIAQDPGTYVIKASDFLDNAGSLHHAPIGREKQARTFAKKYYPLVSTFQEVGATHKLPMTAAGKKDLDEKLARTKSRLQLILREKKTPESVVTALHSKHPDVTVEFIEDSRSGYKVLTSLRVPKSKQGTGVGTEIMEDLVRTADEQGWSLALTPDVAYGASSKARLETFYKRFGFKQNRGSGRDFATREAMVRAPSSAN